MLFLKKKMYFENIIQSKSIEIVFIFIKIRNYLHALFSISKAINYKHQ